MYEPYFGYCQIDFWMSHVVSPASLATHYQTSPILIEISSESKFKKKNKKKHHRFFVGALSSAARSLHAAASVAQIQGWIHAVMTMFPPYGSSNRCLAHWLNHRATPHQPSTGAWCPPAISWAKDAVAKMQLQKAQFERRHELVYWYCWSCCFFCCSVFFCSNFWCLSFSSLFMSSFHDLGLHLTHEPPHSPRFL